MNSYNLNWIPRGQENPQTIHYIEAGSGPMVLMLHGFTESSAIWKPWLQQLERFGCIRCPDFPGHGDTPCDTVSVSMETLADSLIPLIPPSQKAVIIGHSMGGYVGLAFAEKYPERLAGLCLLHSTPMADTAEKKKNRQRTIEVIKSNKGEFLTHFIPMLFAPQNRERCKQQIQDLITIATRTSAKGLLAAIEGMMARPDRQLVVRNLMVPVQFISGRFDEIIPVEQSLNDALNCPNAVSVMLEFSGHMGFIEEKERCIECIIQFINQCSQ